jgi:hypothetical protein
MGLMAYDPERLLDLRIAVAQALDELQGIRCDDVAAHEAMHVVRESCRTINERCLPFVRDVLDSSAMTAWDRSLFTDCGVRDSIFWQLSHERQWLLHDDPGQLAPGEALKPPTPVRGHFPGLTSYDDVLAARDCGEIELLRLPQPMDPPRPGTQQYTTVSIAPTAMTNLGEHEITRNLARFIGFWSDALPIGYHEHKIRSVYRVEDARVVTSTQVVEPDGVEYPVSLAQATVSGYVVMVDLTKGVVMNVNARQPDPTQSLTIELDDQHTYAAAFYPDAQPDFTPVSASESATAPTWRLTTRPAPMNVGRVGTWG